MDLGRRAAAVSLAATALAWSVGCASSADAPPPPDLDVMPYRLVAEHERYLVPGERLTYDVSFLFVKIGEITFETRRSRGPEPGAVVVTNVASPTGLAAALSRYGGYATSWIDAATMLPHRYVWNDTDREEPKRRYNEFFQDEGLISSLQIKGSAWDPALFDVGQAQDPVSVLVLLRVLDLAPGETLRLNLIEGDNRRICTIRAEADEDLHLDRRTVAPARRFSVRTDKLRDGRVTGEEPETDLRSWVSLDDRRVILQSRGRIGGAAVRIRLSERHIEPE